MTQIGRPDVIIVCTRCGHESHGGDVCGYGRGAGPNMCGCQHATLPHSGSLDPYLRQRLVETCTRLGLPPWETVIRPRLHADADAVAALMAQVRADAMRVQGKPARDGRGRFVGRGQV